MKSHTNQTLDEFPTLRFKLLLILTPKRVYYQVLHNSLYVTTMVSMNTPFVGFTKPKWKSIY